MKSKRSRENGMRNKNTSIDQKAIASKNKTLDNECTVNTHLHYPAILSSGIPANLMISLEKQLSWSVKLAAIVQNTTHLQT